jgi:pimeloyl-ACP methyl ester carboxylesterase
LSYGRSIARPKTPTCSRAKPPRASSETSKRVIRGLATHYTNEAADRLGQFDKPALIAWSRDDPFFKSAHAARLAQDLPNARLDWIDNARSLSPEDEPDRIAELIGSFVREPTSSATALTRHSR